MSENELLRSGTFKKYCDLKSKNIISDSQNRTFSFSNEEPLNKSDILVFISHKHSRYFNKELQGFLSLLNKKYKVITYIDSEDSSMPQNTCLETAERIKKVIGGAHRFILFATQDAIRSMWCNWEVGIADKTHYLKNNMAILPFASSRLDPNSYLGNEYLLLYPKIIRSHNNEDDEFAVQYTDGRIISLYKWLNS